MIEYSNTVQRRFNGLLKESCLKVLLCYPNLIFVKSCTVHLVNIDSTGRDRGETVTEDDVQFDLSGNALDAAIHQNLLWLLLDTSKIMVIDLHQNKSTEFIIVTWAKLTKLNFQDETVLFASESEENLLCSSSIAELRQKMEEGNTTFQINVDKIMQTPISSDKKVFVNGLTVHVKEGMLMWECPYTGIKDTVSTPITDHAASILQWEDILILVERQNIWFVDSDFSKMTLEFKTQVSEYYPVATFHNKFYFITFENNEALVQCIQKKSFHGIEDEITDPIQKDKKQQSEDLLKSQLKTIIDNILNQDPIAKPSGEVLNKIKFLYDEIKDLQFLYNNFKLLCSNDIMLKHILFVLQKRAYSEGDKILFDINNLIIALDMLELIHFRNIPSYKNVNVVETRLIDLIVMFVTNSDFDLACMCWLKYAQIERSFVACDVLKILNAVPQNAKMGSLLIWLRNLIPPLLDENPFFIDLFVRWATERVFLLEKSSYWPKIGLKFIDDIKSVLDMSQKTVSIIPTSMDDLDLLKDRIMYIMELKDKYKINMLLGELSSQSPTEVILIMLHRCYTEDLANFLQDYLPNFTTRFCLELDDILQTYIQNEAASGGGNIDETRLSLLLVAFRGPQNKLDCLLNVLRVLDVPWNKIILELATKAAAMAENDFTLNDIERGLAREIEEELNYANLKVVLKKYNFSTACTDYILVLHKIINAPIVSLQDLKVVTHIMMGYEHYGSILYIDRCLRDYDTKEALKYFKTLNRRECRLVIGSLITKYEHILDNVQDDSGVQKCYIDFFKGSKMLSEGQIETLENMYHLKHSHGIKKDLNSMCCEEILNLNFIYGQENKIDPTKSRSLTRLMNLSLTNNSALFELLHRTSSCAKNRKLIESLLLLFSSNDQHTYDRLFSLFASFTHDKKISELSACCKILIQLINNCEEEYIYFLTEILHVMNTFLATNTTMKKLSAVWKFHYIFLPVTSGINDLVAFYAKIVARESIDKKNLKHVYQSNDSICLKIPADLIINGTKDSSYSEDILRALTRMISKLVISQDVDELLLTSLLLILESNQEDRVMWFLDILKGQNDTMPQNMAQYISSPTTKQALSLDDEVSRNAVSYPPHYVLKTKYNMNLAEIAMPDATEETWDVKIILFYLLRQNPDLTLEQLVDICRTLDISINDGLSLQLIALLSSWELKYETFTDGLGNRQIHIQHDDKTLFKKCVIIWESIKNKEFLRDIMHDFWKNGEVSLHGRLVSINPYYYEAYICMYELMQSSDNRYIKEYYLLNFLKEYKRKSAPQQYEFEMFSTKGMFPEIGHYRLPFHLFTRDDMWANLKSEITLETYEVWLPVVSLLSLDSDIQTARDMICSNALKQTMKTRDKINTNLKLSDSWQLTSREEPLLRAAHRCVRHIANMEWAGACLFYVLQGCARGADQVAAAQLCYQFAQRWDSLQPGNRAVRKMERLHSSLSTRHVLHKIDWAAEELVQLTTEPVQLIRAMYLHPKLVDKMSRYDINQAVTEIADKNSVNISSVRIQILENILEKGSDEMVSKKSIGLDYKELITAKYILRATCPKMGAIYLSRIAFDDETDINKYKKLRALQCLMSIVDSDTALKVTYRDREVLWTSILEMYYVINFENIDMPWAVETFKHDKVRALEQLCSSIGSNVEGLKIAANLSHTYGAIHTYNTIIPPLLRAALYDNVIPLLLKIQSAPDETLVKAWHSILLAPFECADYPMTERQKANCIKAINLLPLCPVIKDDDLKEIWKHCVRCKSFGIGCLMLPYMTYETRQSLSEIKRIDKRNLIISLKNLQADTYLVPGAMYVLENMVSKTYR